MNKENIVFGIILLIIGISIIISPRWYDWKFAREIDVSGYNILIGGACLVFGLYVFWYEYRKGKRKGPDRKRE